MLALWPVGRAEGVGTRSLLQQTWTLGGRGGVSGILAAGERHPGPQCKAGSEWPQGLVTDMK